MTAPAARSGSRRRWLLPLLAFLAVAIATAAFLWWRTRDAASTVVSGPGYQTLTQSDYRVTIPAPGSLRAGSSAELRSGSAGTVAYLATLGARVEAGEVVARLVTTDLERNLRDAELALERAERDLSAIRSDQADQRRSLDHRLADAQTAVSDARTALDEATEQLGLTQRLAAVGSVSSRELSQAELDQASAEARLSLAQRDLEDVHLDIAQRGRAEVRDLANAESALEQAQLGLVRAEEALADAELRAPFAGVVDALSSQVGGYVSANAALLSLVDDRHMELVAYVDETEVGQLQLGQGASVTVLAAGGRPVPATLSSVAPSATMNQNIPVFEVVLTLQDPPAALRPGMTAEAEIVVREEPGTFTVPLGAVRPNPELGAPSLMVRDDEEAPLRAVAVQIVATAGGSAVVRGELPEGGQVEVPANASVLGLRTAGQGGQAGGLLSTFGGAGGERVTFIGTPGAAPVMIPGGAAPMIRGPQ